jgi:outer membrane protein assembly factor BamC
MPALKTSPMHGLPHWRRPTARALALRWIAVAAAMAVVSGCSSVENALSGDRVDYRSTQVRSTPLDVPPDLTQLARDPRYVPQTGGTISATGFPGQATIPTSTVAVAPQAVTPSGVAASPAVAAAPRLERAGNQRWLVVGQTPEQLWPRVQAFWKERGFTLATEQPEIGILETDWAENRAKLPQDIIRATIGRALSALYSTGERDRFRTRIERTPTGSEIFISHRGMVEVYADSQKNTTMWQPRPADPELEAEFLLRLSAMLSGVPSRPTQTAGAAPAAGTAATTVAAATPSTPVAPARARVVDGQPSAALQLDEPFDRAWRRVGLALDRSGFTVEDRDRGSGLYFVRFVPPPSEGGEQPGVLARLFSGRPNPSTAQRLRIQVKGESDSRSMVNVLNAEGAADQSNSARRIVALLVEDLK